MKQFGFSASIHENNNFAISHGDAHWGQIRPNSSIRFGDDDIFYSAIKTEELFYIKDCIVQNGNELIVEDNATINLLHGDTLDISYKEYELFDVSVINGGTNYKQGNLLSVSGGLSPINPVDGLQKISTLSIDEVGSAGQVIKISIKNRGKYTVQPEENSKVNGGFGTGLELKLNYRLCPERAIMEREIESIVHNANNSVIKIVYPLPEGINDAKLSVTKWKLYLDRNYVGKTKLNTNYQIIRDVTPNYGFPLITDGSFSIEKLISRFAMMADSKIKELQDKIDNLS